MEYTFSYFKLFISDPSIELPCVKYHKVIFSWLGRKHCLTELRAKVNMLLTDIPTSQTAKAEVLWPHSRLLSAAPSPTFPNHTGLQAVPGACQAHSCLGLCCSLCLEPCVICLLHLLLQILSQILPLSETFPYHPVQVANTHPQHTGSSRHCQSPPLLYVTAAFTFWHPIEDPSHPHPTAHFDTTSLSLHELTVALINMTLPLAYLH